MPACAGKALKTTASIDPRRAAPPSGHTGAATPPLEAVEAARTTPPPRQAAHDTPPPSLVTREATRETRETHLSVGGGGGGGGGERGWTRWWEGGGHDAKLETRSETPKMEATRKSDEEAGTEERPSSVGEVKHRPRPLLHPADGKYRIYKRHCPLLAAHLFVQLHGVTATIFFIYSFSALGSNNITNAV